jgi:20S proteasome alpha/beta subunit
MFSPSGRLHQLEYASEAVRRSLPAIGIRCSDGVVLCALRRRLHPTLQPQLTEHKEKVFVVDDSIALACAGLSADAAALLRELRSSAASHRQKYSEGMPVRWAVSSVCDLKQAYTQRGGLRPWGVSLLVAGWDSSEGMQLYVTDPAGDFRSYYAAAVGGNSTAIMQDIVEAMPLGSTSTSGNAGELWTMEEGLAMAVGLLAKHSGSGDLEVCLITMEEDVDGFSTAVAHMMSPEDAREKWNKSQCVAD